MNIQETIARVARFTDQYLIQDFKDHLGRDRIVTVDLLIRIADRSGRTALPPGLRGARGRPAASDRGRAAGAEDHPGERG